MNKLATAALIVGYLVTICGGIGLAVKILGKLSRENRCGDSISRLRGTRDTAPKGDQSPFGEPPGLRRGFLRRDVHV